MNKEVPMLIMNGKEDSIVWFEGRILKSKKDGDDMHFVPADFGQTYFKEKYNCL